MATGIPVHGRLHADSQRVDPLKCTLVLLQVLPSVIGNPEAVLFLCQTACIEKPQQAVIGLMDRCPGEELLDDRLLDILGGDRPSLSYNGEDLFGTLNTTQEGFRNEVAVLSSQKGFSPVRYRELISGAFQESQILDYPKIPRGHRGTGLRVIGLL